MSVNLDRDWYAVRTQTRCEQRVKRALMENGLEAYLPIEKRWKWTRSQKTEQERPLFTGYIFVALSRAAPEFYTVKNIDGVASFIGVNNRPIAIQFYRVERANDEPEDFSIQSLMEAETLGLFDFTRSKKITFKPDQPVRIIGGPFTGFMAKVLADPGEEKRVRILMQAIGRGRSMPTNIDVGQIVAA